jgi:hypothetical protein
MSVQFASYPLMTKYYVNAKTIRGIIDANSPKEAAKKVLKKFGRGKIPSSYTEVGDKGWNDDYLFDSYILLGELYNEHQRASYECRGSGAGVA